MAHSGFKRSGCATYNRSSGRQSKWDRNKTRRISHIIITSKHAREASSNSSPSTSRRLRLDRPSRARSSKLRASAESFPHAVELAIKVTAISSQRRSAGAAALPSSGCSRSQRLFDGDSSAGKNCRGKAYGCDASLRAGIRILRIEIQPSAKSCGDRGISPGHFA